MLIVVLLTAFSQATYAQLRSISGIVKDATGLPVIGANVKEAGTSNGTITDFDGNFILNVNTGSLLNFSYIGYKDQEVMVKNQKSLVVVLQENSEELEEVVVVGYGQQKKESVVGAISTVSSKELLKSSSPNITQAISGKVPGLITSQGSGAPGADDAKIYIRGRASFAGDNQPLVMVDGVEREFSQIAPDDIESISVLKDASATAVYGVRGANGVILVTTKRGSDQKAKVSFTANVQMQTPTRKDTYLDSYNSVLLLEEALKNDGLQSQFSAFDIEMYKKSVAGQLSLSDQQLYPNVNWYDEILNKWAPAQRYNVNIQGGSKRMRYFASLEYYNQGGLYKDNNNYDYGKSSNVNYNRYQFRANLDFLITKDFTASLNFGTRFEERKGPNIIDNRDVNEVFYELNHTPGWLFPVKYENGYYGGNSQNQNNISAKLANGGFYENSSNINETNFILNYDLNKLTKGLSVKAMLSFDYYNQYDRRFSNTFATYELINRSAPELESSYSQYSLDGELAYAGNTQVTSMKTYMEFAVNYARSFGVHNVSGLLLYNQNDYQYQADLSKRYQGLVGRATYNYDNKYFVEFNAGFNGSENFLKGNRFGFFPSVSGGWMISNEKFMDSTKGWLDKLKIRASYGEVGNDVYQRNGNDVRFLYVGSWSQLNNVYYFGNNTYYTGIYEGQYPNLNVTWERAQKYNVAFEASFLNDMFSLNVDLFKENRSDILTDYLTKPSWTAVDLAPGNLGKTKNQGYEIELHHRNKVGQVFYNVSASFSHAKNEITEMDEPEFKTEYRKRTGHAIDQYFGLVCDGYITQADIDGGKLPVSTFGNTQIGDLKYRDMNNDGFIDERDETFIGYSNIPQNTYSVSLGLEWKNWSLSVMFQGVDKVSRYYDAESLYAFVDGGKVKEHHLDRWNPGMSEAYNLANAKYPLLHYNDYGNHNQQTNSYFLKNGAFVRLKNAEIAYTLPKQWLRGIGISDVRIYANGNNLFTWDNLDGMTDPESTNSNLYPIMKSFNFGVNIKF